MTEKALKKFSRKKKFCLIRNMPIYKKKHFLLISIHLACYFRFRFRLDLKSANFCNLKAVVFILNKRRENKCL